MRHRRLLDRDFSASRLHDFSVTYRKVMRSVVTVRTNTAAGTGFILAGSGLIVTCAHVVDDGQAIRVRLWNGRSVPARVLCADPDADIACLAADGIVGITGLHFIESARVKPGLPVALLGNALGEGLALTSGIVSALRRSESGHAYVQTTAPMNHGVSGAPVFDYRGRLVGMATSGRGEAQAMNFALDSSEVQRQLAAARKLKTRSRAHNLCRGCKSTLRSGADVCSTCGKQTTDVRIGANLMSVKGKALSKRDAKECAATLATALEELEIVVEPSYDDEFESVVWEFISNRSKVFVVFSPAVVGGWVQVRALVAQLPNKGLLALYRRLLELNGEQLPFCALGVTDDFVTLATTRTAKGLKKSHVKEMLVSVAEAAGQIDEHLIEEFGCRPIAME
jgi:S1-C subfamily serine protease